MWVMTWPARQTFAEFSVVWAATTRSLGAGPVRWPAAVGSAETFKPVGELREGPTMNSFCAESPRD